MYKGALTWEKGCFPQRCRMRKLEETGEVWFLLPETRNGMNTDKIFKYVAEKD